MSFSFLTVPLVSGGWGCSSQTNEVFGVLPSTPAETITLGEYAEALQPKNRFIIWALLLLWLPCVNADCQAKETFKGGTWGWVGGWGGLQYTTQRCNG